MLPTPTAASNTELVDLRQVSGAELEDVLSEETETWRELLDWDFLPSAELVTRFVNMQALSGFAISVDGRLSGYTYYIAEERKGLIGDIFVSRPVRTWEREGILLEAALDALVEWHGVGRIESQLMMLGADSSRPMPRATNMQVFDRTFMVRDLPGSRLCPSRVASGILIESWREERQEEAAQLIALAYQGHIDSRINDQYQSVPGARRFLLNIVQYPGCGRFFGPASFLAFRKDTGLACGMILSSLVADSVGHITQVCVTPDMRGKGAGYELMRVALDALASYGCRKVSLTVTTVNETAIRLYESIGFHKQRVFHAHVWDGL